MLFKGRSIASNVEVDVYPIPPNFREFAAGYKLRRLNNV